MVVEKKPKKESGILGGWSRVEKIHGKNRRAETRLWGIRKSAWAPSGLTCLLDHQMRVLRRQLDAQVPCTKKKSGQRDELGR